MKEPDAGTPQPDSRPTTIEARCEGRRQSKQRRNLNSPACYSGCNSRGDRLSKNWTQSGAAGAGRSCRNSIGIPNPQIRTPVPKPVAAGLEHKEPQPGPL